MSGKRFVESLSTMTEYPSLEITDEEILKIALGGRTAFLRVISILFPPLVPIILKQPAKEFFITFLATLLFLVPGAMRAWKLVSSMHGKLLKKHIVRLPFRFNLKVNFKCSVKVKLIKFNVRKWNQAVEKNKQLRAQNDEKEHNYNILYSQYEGNMARYEQAKQERDMQMMSKSLNSTEKGYILCSSSLKKPSKPSKPDYYEIKDLEIKDLDKNDFYEHSGNEMLVSKINEYTPDEDHSIFFTFVNDHETFNSLMLCLEYTENINEFVEGVYSAENRWSLKHVDIKHNISDDSTKLDFDRKIMEKVIKSHIEGLVHAEASKKFSVPDKIKIGGLVIDYSKFDSNLDVIDYVPFLSIDYETRNGTQKQGLMEFVTKSML